MNETQEIELYMEEVEIPMGDYGAVTELDGMIAAGLFGGMMFMFIMIFALIVVMIVANWKIFTKAGEKGWKSLVPFYNNYILLEISGKPGWWLIWFFVPIANIVVAIMMYDGLSKSFGKGIGYTLGLIFLSPIFFLMLAFGSAVYTKPAEDKNDADVFSQNPT